MTQAAQAPLVESAQGYLPGVDGRVPRRLARRLAAPAPGWTTTADAIVVGSGIAGLTAALELRTHVPRVLLVTKGELSSGSTVWAQGGIAAALDPSDSPAAHLEDTLAAGGGLCDPAAVEVLVTEGPERVRELVGRGANFDLAPGGVLALTRTASRTQAATPRARRSPGRSWPSSRPCSPTRASRSSRTRSCSTS